MYQKPSVGRALSGSAEGAHSTAPNPLAVLGRTLREVCRRRGSKKGTEAEKRGCLGNEGRRRQVKDIPAVYAPYS